MSEWLHHLPMLSRFALVLALTLLLRRAAEKRGLAGPIGFIAAGALLGPHGIGMLDVDGPVVVFFSDLGKLLLMFFAGFEIDTEEFSKARAKAALFGLLTFSLPFAAGYGVAWLAGYALIPALVVGSILASHTLLGLPVVKEAGLMSNPAVVVTVGATVFTDVLAILVLAICLPIHLAGFSPGTLAAELLELVVFVPLILLGLAWVTKWALRNHGESESLRSTIMLLAMAAAAQLAEIIQLEGIIGAFLAGIAVKRAFGPMPADQSLSEISHTLFIPAFFITAGFLIDLKVFVLTIVQHPLLVIGIVGGLIGAKWLAAQLTGLLLRYSAAERGVMFALSVPQVAATLAVALVAYAAINPAGQRLIDLPMLNTVIVLVIVTSIVGLLWADRYSKRIAAAAPPAAAAGAPVSQPENVS